MRLLSETPFVVGMFVSAAVWGGSSVTGVWADDDLGRQLQESLGGSGDAGEEDSPVMVVNRLLENTDSARERLAAGELDERTAAIQQQILDDLDALIGLAGSSPPAGSSSAPPSGEESPSQTSGSGQSGQSQAEQAQTAAGKTESTGSGEPGGDPNAMSRESAERTAMAGETAADRERRLGLATAAWGHLPPKVREQMRSAFSETYLPEYDELVRRYYEALAARREQRERPAAPLAP